MGEMIFDSTGVATLFHTVPLHAVKKATFKTKLGILHDLLQMTWNNVTYDFTQTAKNGAVVFSNSYQNWEFVAPDDVLDFNSYQSMTIGEALDAVRTTTISNPIPAWNKFAIWVGNNHETINSFFNNDNIVTILRPATGSQTMEELLQNHSMNQMEFVADMTSVADIIDVLKNAFGDLANKPLSDYDIDSSNLKFNIELYDLTNGNGMTVYFTFRE